MAGRSRAKAKKNQSKNSQDRKNKGPESPGEGQKYKTMAELHRVEALVVQTPEEVMPLSPRSSLVDLQNQQKDKAQLSEWLTIMKKNQGRLDAKDSGNPQSRQLLNEFDQVQNVDPMSVKTTIKIDIEDIQDEINYWESSIICYVIGANPPFPIMEGFLKRIWKNKGIDKMVAISKGVFLVRFHKLDDCNAVMAEGFQFFDKKPMIVKKWNPDMDFKKEDIKTVPIWLQLPSLELKYWGEKCLFKLVQGIGKPLRLDQATQSKDRLMYARVLVETKMNQVLPDFIEFENEKGQLVQQMINYEWRPVQCNICKGIGHGEGECKKGRKGVKKQWVEKPKVLEIDDEGFQRVKGVSVNKSDHSPVIVHNAFDALKELETNVLTAGIAETVVHENEESQDGKAKEMGIHGEEGEPPTMNG